MVAEPETKEWFTSEKSNDFNWTWSTRELPPRLWCGSAPTLSQLMNWQADESRGQFRSNILRATIKTSHCQLESLIKMNYETHETRISRSHLSSRLERGWAVAHKSTLMFEPIWVLFRVSSNKISAENFWKFLMKNFFHESRESKMCEFSWTEPEPLNFAHHSHFRTFHGFPGQNKLRNDFMKRSAVDE